MIKFPRHPRLPDTTVDVVITCYDEENTIANAIESVLEQTYRDILGKIIVVDDGSIDGSRVILSKFTRTDRRLHLVFQENAGLPAARNAGIRRCTAPWIALLDGDDMWAPEKLEVQIDTALRCNADFVFCDSVHYGEDGGRTVVQAANFRSRDSQTHTLLRELPPIYPSTVIIHSTLLRKVGMFEEKLLLAQDTLLWLKLSTAGKMIRVPLPLCHRSVRSDSLGACYVRKMPFVSSALELFCSEFPEFSAEVRNAKYGLHLVYIDRLLAAGEKEMARRYGIRLLTRYPFRRSLWQKCSMLVR